MVASLRLSSIQDSWNFNNFCGPYWGTNERINGVTGELATMPVQQVGALSQRETFHTHKEKCECKYCCGKQGAVCHDRKEHHRWPWQRRCYTSTVIICGPSDSRKNVLGFSSRVKTSSVFLNLVFLSRQIKCENNKIKHNRIVLNFRNTLCCVHVFDVVSWQFHIHMANFSRFINMRAVPRMPLGFQPWQLSHFSFASKVYLTSDVFYINVNKRVHFCQKYLYIYLFHSQDQRVNYIFQTTSTVRVVVSFLFLFVF